MKKYLYVFSFTLLSCSGGGDSQDPGEPEIKDPQAASLVYPENNTECEEGVPLSETQNRITFIWNEAPDTDSYTLYITDLDKGNSNSFNATSTQKEVTLERGAPYSWYVVSKAAGTQATASSPTWKFYNAGSADSNHPPFPAEVIAPAQGATINAGSITLKWNTTDMDGDLDTESVLFGTSDPPTATISAQPGEAQVDANPATVYYWQVISTDKAGNRTESQVFSFRTQ